MSDTSLVFNLVTRDQTGEGLSQARERFDTAAAGIGAGVGMALGAGIVQNLNVESANSKLAAQLGLGATEAAEAATVSAAVYGNAWGDSVETVNLAIKGVYQNIGDTSSAEGGLEAVTTKALALADTFDQDLTMTTAAVGQLMRTGLADSADEAFDIITTGLGTSADKAGDFLETLNEYSTQWRRVGLDGQTATGLIAQGLAHGAKDADQVGDAIGQFGEIALAGGSSVDTAFKSIGLNSATMAKMIGQGGDSAQQALQMTTDALRGTTNEQVKLNAAGTLFGDPGKIMGDALFALDPAGAAAAAGMDKAAGSTDRLVKTAGGSAAASLEEFKRKAMQQLGEAAGYFIKFATDNKAVVVPLAYTLAGLAVTVLAVKAAMITYSAVAAVVSAAQWLMDTSVMKTTVGWLRMNAVGLAVYARIAAGAVASALATAAAWTGSALVSIGTWILNVVRAAVVSAAQFAMMAARAVAWAVVMAAQWLIAMGPVGWVIAVIVGLVVLVIANWSTVQRWTGKVWDWVWKKVVSAVGLVLGAVMFLGRLPGMVGGYFGRMKDAAVRKALELVGWVGGMPGRISSGLGSMSDLLVSKGMNVVHGLWSGIQSMGGWIAGKLTSWARSVIPGPIARALGISSPSKVTRAQGRWIARGLVDGMTGSAQQVRAAAAKLSDIVADSLAPGKKRSKALGVISSGTGQLIRLANKEAGLAARMKTASKSLADQIKARAALAADVRKGILDAANITQSDTGKPVTADDILGNLMTSLGRARKFTADLASLRKKGVRSDLIEQIERAGVEQGSATAAALARADKGTIKQINSTQGALVTAATRAGAVAGDAMYGAGVRSAQGLVKGLAAQQSAIEKQMLRIAAGMKNAIKKALGIRSPSALMADEVGRWIPPGLVEGIRATAPQLDRAMSNLVRPELANPARPLTAGMASLMGAQAGGGTVTVRFEVVEGEFKKLLRKTVRVDGRGNIQILTG